VLTLWHLLNFGLNYGY